ncbi:putative ABC transport system permease protein [Clostridium acetobutylicum]|uniref:Predicted ABC transporter, permease component n=1 Tax=Clostridium acetobutylicum (strain ATCC 824 / DSM 792 / JCM 1419 / IAM 19013 / LMG 5710 / NBRC 13948 / NRRL B-527 / VKM B-1787 / 2291 / W) TaxID=272562 RepID=Q97MN0_CLOAB|nr:MULTISPECIES: ABC transporter permease [Clostridium]AAK78148.1 Predicted ABC transporter, permease component [Clostridium acetobutylicum ATCC 824]ADZ19210.1 ABC transporter, permease component [Clostridium acetobutylicum EA 2018]AEI31090.1 ABC transporter permease [Clostridium acetobutylicum DSM 1731]AWV82265.1 ABC transporter permease [Clostridium acetobutylicum]MBC2395978.1 ABC transporter permease [Clostridium acetobutylicum]
MGAYIFAFKMLKKNTKKNLIYLISIIFTMAIVFNLLNVINNTNFFAAEVTGGKNDIAADIIFLLVLLMCIFTFYANSYFIMGKSKEMAIAELSGIWPGKLSRMLLFQNAIIEIIGCALGILIGMLLMPIFLSIMYTIMGKTGGLWVISNYSIGGTIAILFLQLVYVTIGDYSYTSTREVIDLLESEKRSRPKEKRYLSIAEIIEIIGMKKKTSHYKIKILNEDIDLCLISYFIPVIFLFICPRYIPMSIAQIFIILLSVYSIEGILRHSIPEKILKLKKEKYSDDKIKLIALSNVYVSLKNLKFLLITLVISIEGILLAITMFNSLRVKTICLFSYVTVIVLIDISIFYKIIMEADTKNHIFNQLALIGYTTEQIREIVKQEFRIYYGIIITLPLFHVIIFFILLLKIGMVSFDTLLIMLFIYLGIFFITGIGCYYLYRKLILRKNIFRFL